MITRMPLPAALILLGWFANSVTAVITSDQPGSHLTTPGELAFGVNIDGVVLIGGGDPDSETISDLLPHCTGALITDRHILTAAHCFDEDKDGVFDFRFVFPHVAAFELADRTVMLSINTGEDGSGSVRLPDEWPDVDADLAVIELQEDAPPEVPRYPLYGGTNEVGKPVVLVGYGATGSGESGIDEVASEISVKRAGLNRYDDIRDDMPGVDFLAYDFDSGLKENNAIALIGFESDLGFGADEVLIAPGDSGGPGFVHGAIAGVHSFGARIPAADIDEISNSSWGEVSFDTRVSQFQEFILQATNGQAVFVLPGDFNTDDAVTAMDIDLLSAAVRDENHESRFDLNSDGEVNHFDRSMLVTDIASTFFGDADLDMEVAFTDFLVLADNFSDFGGWAEGDFDGSGDVQFADFQLLAGNFGQSALAVVAVPEPAGGVTILIVALLLLRKRRIDIF